MGHVQGNVRTVAIVWRWTGKEEESGGGGVEEEEAKH